jgi:GDP-L-fucose synthase
MGYWTGKRVVVTGGGGFLGSHVVEQVRQTDCASVFVVRQRDYDLTREADARRLFAEHPADVLLHLAGYVGGIGANKAQPADFFYKNLMMNTHTLHQAFLAGVGKVVNAGAGCGYPEHAPLPLCEANFWDGYPQAESAPYSLAKRMQQVQSLAYWNQHRFLSVVTIPGNIYGPYDNFDLEAAHVVPALVRKFVEAADDRQERIVVWGSGNPTRDFVYAGDVAEGILRAAERYARPEIVNLASGRETSIAEVVRTLADLTQYPGQIVWDTARPDGQSRRLFDVRKAERDLGWRARTSLYDGLKKTVAWYRANRDTARNVA